MRYIDSGNRDPSQALGSWLGAVMGASIDEVRWQTGFFSADSLGLLQDTLQRLARENRAVKALVGSNDRGTLRQDIETLVAVLGVPRAHASLAVVGYAEGFFHPKTFHIKRNNGSQAAYVGSANLTRSGVSSQHVEAGVILDTAEGDSAEILSSVASAVDWWFASSPAGMHRVASAADAARLVSEGVLGETRPPRPTPTPSSPGSTPPPRLAARLTPLIPLPVVTVAPPSPPPAPSRIVAPPAAPVAAPASPRPDFPPYLLFAPGQKTPTQGALALSGATLPSGVSGLIIRLNRDSARHFEGRVGTANISVPVATLSTFRFGLFVAQYTRPRAEFDLRIRYLGDKQTLVLGKLGTNIMAYGFMAGEAGHGDVRMLVPGGVKELASELHRQRLPAPHGGELALLEWPTTNPDREFRLSFMQEKTELYVRAEALFAAATDSGALVGGGACWLPDGFAPEW